MGRRRGTSISAEVMPKARMKGREGKGMEFASFTIGWSRGVVKLLSMLKKMEKGGWL
jgi:hypothetical protein